MVIEQEAQAKIDDAKHAKRLASVVQKKKSKVGLRESNLSLHTGEGTKKNSARESNENSKKSDKYGIETFDGAKL